MVSDSLKPIFFNVRRFNENSRGTLSLPEGGVYLLRKVKKTTLRPSDPPKTKGHYKSMVYTRRVVLQEVFETENLGRKT